MPDHLKSLPHVGDCVALFAKKLDMNGKPVEWTSDSMKLMVEDRDCQ